jgi:3-dehydroquinate dehydratase II
MKGVLLGRGPWPGDAMAQIRFRCEQMRRVLVLHGPNLNLLGRREPEVYGTATLADIEQICRSHAEEKGWSTQFLQSNHEGDLIDALHQAEVSCHGVILNAGGYAHTSIALRDAVSGIGVPTVEVHLTDIRAREAFRQVSLIEDVALHFVCGMGSVGYLRAIDRLVEFWER